jgi:hypothetical protein
MSIITVLRNIHVLILKPTICIAISKLTWQKGETYDKRVSYNLG